MTESTTPPLFQLLDGQPSILSAFFSKSKDAVEHEKLHDVPRRLLIYGDGKPMEPLYLHLMVENLLSVNAGSTRVFPDVKFAVDFFAVSSETAKFAYQTSNLGEVSFDEELFSFTVELAFGDQEITSSPSELRNVVSMVPKNTKKSVPVPVNVPVQVTFKSKDPKTNRRHDLCFEVPIPREDLKRLEDAPTYAMEVMAWAWVVSEHTKKQYKDGLTGITRQGLNVAEPYERMRLLKLAAAPWIVRVSATQNREDYKALPPPNYNDPFVFDEPTFNMVRFSKQLPFKTLEVATQLGSVGFCNNNIMTYYGNELLYEHVALLDLATRTAISRARSSADQDGNITMTIDGFLHGEDGAETFSEAPHVQTKLELGGNAFPYAINELQNSYEEQYLFREGSAAQWLNTIEKSLLVGGTEHEQPSPGSVFAKGQLGAFTNAEKGKFTVFSCDFLRDYSDKVRNGSVHAAWKQKEMDLGEFDTVSVPEAKLTDSAGVFQLELGKGFPAASPRYVNWLHTKVELEGDATNDKWQAHPYCHRPVFVAYELLRDLKSSEATRLMDAWKSRKATGELGLRIGIHLPSAPGLFSQPPVVFLPFPFLDERCGKQGKHLLLLYVTLPQEARLTVSLTSADVVETPPCMGLNLKGYVEIQASTVDALVTYRGDDASGAALSGLFEGNPIVSIESLTPLETRQKALDADTKTYDSLTSREQGKLLLSFIPAYGSMLAAGWETSLRLVDYSEADPKHSVPKAKMLELGVTILAEILGNVLRIRIARLAKAAEEAAAAGAEIVEKGTESLLDKGLNWVGSITGKTTFAGAKATAGYLDKVDNDFRQLEQKLEAHRSPFKRSARFQEDPRVRDQAVLIRLRKQEWELKTNSAGFVATAPRMEEVAEAFFVRPVDLPLNATFPFHYCFGPTGGCLERDDAAADCAIDRWENEYFGMLKEYKAKVPEKQSIDQYFAWLSDSNHLADAPFSKSVKEYFAANASRLGRLHGAQAGQPPKTGKLSASDRADLLLLSATTHLWGYLNVMFIRCPACGRDMQLNWGWCPYHPTENKAPYVLSDKNKSGSWKDEFIAALRDPDPDGKWKLDENVFGPNMAVGLVTIADYLEGFPAQEETRLFVHCSEFIVIK